LPSSFAFKSCLPHFFEVHQDEQKKMSPGPRVKIPGCGEVQGSTATSQPTVAKLLNSPFATVPERWRPAIKAAAWQGIRNGTKQG